MCIINNKLKKKKIPLALEKMFRLFPCNKNYLLFIVDKFATFCVTFLTEVKRKKNKQKDWSLVCGFSIKDLSLHGYFKLQTRS